MRLRSWWAERQGLTAPGISGTPAEVLARSGWARSVGGANPYLTLFARAGTSRAATDAAVTNLEIHELPSARGCTYVVPAEDFALALKISQGSGDTGDIQVGKKFLGVTEEELVNLSDRVLKALGEEPKDPAALRKELGDAVRSLGEEGKKRGATTTLPMVLGRLQTRGQIRRVPIGGRLDQQRYGYTAWKNNPLDGFDMTTEEAYVVLARKFFHWTGPASVAHFQWFSGLGVKASKAALAPLGLIAAAPESDLLILPENRDEFEAHIPSTEPHYRLVSALDALFLLRRDVPSLINPEDRERKVLGDKGMIDVGRLMDLTTHAILDRGRIIGLWEYEQPTASIVAKLFIESNEALQKEIDRMETYIRDQLGDCRSFSLDSPASRQKTIDALKAS